MIKLFLRSLAVCLAFFLALGAFLVWQDYREAQLWQSFWESVIELELME